MRSLLPASHLSCGGNSLRPKLDLVGASEASVMPAVFQSNSGCLKLLYRPSLTRFSAQRTPTSHVSRVAARSTQAQTFDALAGLLCPTELQIGLGTTNLGRGLVADRDLPAGTTLLTVDAFSTLCVVDEPLRTGDAFGAAVLSDWQAVWGVELPPLLVSYLRSSRGDWFRRLVAWLLWLKRHSKHPVWQLYLQLLPQEDEMSSLMNFTPQERAELQLPHLVALAEKERDGIQGLHDSLFSSSTGELRALDLAPDFSDTLWAACMVNSRCFSDAAGRELLSLMVPLADMANHSNTPNAGYRLDSASQTFSIVSTQVIPAGDEVLISYLGERPSKSSTDLMKDYGFVLPGNINDVISFEVAGDKQQQQQLLSPAALLQAAAAAAAEHVQGDAPEAAAQQRRLQAVMKSLQPYVAQPADAGPVQKQGPADSSQQQLYLVQVLQQQCQQQAERLPTTVDEDKQLLCEEQHSSRLQAAVTARLEHKLLLAAALDLLGNYAGQISGSD